MSVDDIWYGSASSDRAIRAMLSPASWLYGAITAARNTMYDRAILRSYPSAIPVVSVGNVTVGGTGKTPFSALLVETLRKAGHTPAVVMRGYGDDERHLHARMSPGVTIVTDADRVAGIRAAASSGADIVVLDDAFQHRRARRDLDIVLISAERWRPGLMLLPAGPLREPIASIRRADLVVVTRKIASSDEARAVQESVAAIRGTREGIAEAELAPSALTSATSVATLSLEALAQASVLAVAGIGDPESFFSQLRACGARVAERRFRDHHDYTAAEAAALASESRGHKYVVTTEKDAVKLSGRWPANGVELWYLSQVVRLTEGSAFVAAALAKLFKRATSIAG